MSGIFIKNNAVKVHTNKHRQACYPAVLISICAAVTGNATGLNLEEHNAIYQELQTPILLTLENSQVITGHSIRVFGEQLQVGTSQGAGEAIYTFHIDEIDHFEIPGESYKALAVEWMQDNEIEKATQLMYMLYEQRVHLIPFLPPSESHFFIYYVDLLLQSAKPARAIAISNLLKPQIQNTAAIHKLEDALLESYHKLELHRQARPLAEAWVAERNPYGSSALGYYVLSSAKLADKHYDEALELALLPIVFSSSMSTDKLAGCYAVAISAALKLRKKEYALLLYQEMQQRDLMWPRQNQALAPFHQKILKVIHDT